jgi:hypothetical protein
MFITACNLSFLAYTECLIRSMLILGCVKEDAIGVMVLGSVPERHFMRARLHRQFKSIQSYDVDPFGSDFDFMREVIEAGHWPVFADYLRAWISKRIPRYIWIDSDILVTGDILGLETILDDSRIIHMARCHPIKSRQPPDKFCKVWMAYADMYAMHFGKPLPELGDDSISSCNWNSGVMILDRNYEPLWREIFCHLGPYWRTTFRDFVLSAVPYGQGIWNLIFWHLGGRELHPDYNCVDPLVKPGLVNHYSMTKNAKVAMLVDAVKLNVA